MSRPEPTSPPTSPPTAEPIPEPGATAFGNVADVVRLAARRYGDAPALVVGAFRRSWAELDAAVDAGVRALHSAGAVPGQRAAMAMPTGPDQAAALLAVLRAGLIAVQVEPGHRDLSWVGRRVEASLAVTDRSDHGCAHRIGTADIAGWWERGAADRDPGQQVHPVGAGAEDIALLARSGRSGPPVMLSHRAILAALAASTAAPGFDVTGEDRLVQALPLYHLVGLVSTFLPAALVGAAVAVPELGVPGRTPAEAVLHAIHEHGVTVLPAEPTLYRQLSRADGFADAVAGVRLMLCGSYAVDPPYVAAIRDATGLTVRQGYGISESAATVTSTLMTTAPDGRPGDGSVGVGYPGIGVRIVTDDGDDTAGADEAADLPDDERRAGDERDAGDPVDTAADDGDTLADLADDGGIGRIAISGPTLFSGYWPDGAGGPDVDGWFVTGDIGYLDDDGELHLVDRAAETVVVSGFTVYPREVESALCSHPAIADAAIIGVPSGTGSSIAAVVVLRAGAEPTAAELDEFLTDKLAPFKRPSAFQVVDVLPRTEVGRLDRDELRAGFAAGGGMLAPPEPEPEPEPGPTSEPPPGPESTAADVDIPREAADPESGPDRAADLSTLGTRLPATGTRAGRSAQDTDDDLF